MQKKGTPGQKRCSECGFRIRAKHHQDGTHHKTLRRYAGRLQRDERDAVVPRVSKRGQ